ncbi:MAG: thiol:disulfide interchange protein [Ignavibacteria bacterium RIFOXYA2_FULL_37_17]|nr:MAG: thiol:disulfide interchange protein [Ignavibacteria bacterium RIFOXYA2_FULL_37_17]
MKLRNSISWIIFLVIISVCVSFAQPQLVTITLEKNNLKVTAGREFKVVLNASIQSGWHINSDKPNDEFLIPTTIKSGNKSFQVSKIDYPQPDERKLAISEKPVSVFENDIKVGLIFKIDKSTASGKYKIPIQFGYQGCNDQTCMPPTDAVAELNVKVVGETVRGEKREVKGETSTVKGKKLEVKSETSNVENEKQETTSHVVAAQKDESSIASTLEKSGLFLSLIFVFLAGLALNLTPCVYPLIPITIGYFGGQAEGKTSRLFLLGILYVLGMALTYSVVGVVTSLSGAVFGTLLQNPIVIIVLGLIFIALALSQFGVYEFKLPDSWVMKAGGAKGGAFGAFFMGLTMGIVAAPCIGPFLLGLVTYVAAKGDPFYGFIMFFVMAMGLGTPYLILALFSGKIKSLPRAGLWMEGVKHIFGFLLLGMAIYFVNPLLPKNISGYTLPVFGLITAIILLLLDKTANNVKGFRIFKTVFSLLVMVLSVYALIPSKTISPEWQKFSEIKYESSLKNNERMVIDFYADWCIPCKELDAITFSNAKVIKELVKFSKYKVDMTKTTDENDSLRKKFKVVGMPTVLIIDAKGTEVNRLSGFVNAEEFLKIIEQVE